MTGNTDPGSGTIVVGVDDTAAAVRWAVQEARLRQASVHLVCADDPGRRSRAPYAARPGPPWPEQDNAASDGAAVPRSSTRAGPCRRVACHLS